MREIKFRAWNGKEFIDVGVLDLDKEEAMDYYNWWDGYWGEQVDYTGDKQVLFQYTGRKDKNDREVFEGDIYRIEEETDGLDEVFHVVVIWIDEWSMFASVLLEEYHRYKVGGAKELDEQLFWTYTLNDINSPKHFYCGDIYQNPDLLQC